MWLLEFLNLRTLIYLSSLNVEDKYNCTGHISHLINTCPIPHRFLISNTISRISLSLTFRHLPLWTFEIGPQPHIEAASLSLPDQLWWPVCSSAALWSIPVSVASTYCCFLGWEWEKGFSNRWKMAVIEWANRIGKRGDGSWLGGTVRRQESWTWFSSQGILASHFLVAPQISWKLAITQVKLPEYWPFSYDLICLIMFRFMCFTWVVSVQWN